MTKGKQRSTKARPARSGRQGRGLAHRPGVWLATVSTVVGIATGMFTLRDQVSPQESGTAGAAGVTSYRQHVGEICDELNDADRARARDTTRLGRRLKRARTTLAQRDALLDGVRRTTARSTHALSGFAGLEAPERYAKAQRSVAATWKRNLNRVLVYAERLDQVTSRRDLIAAIQVLSHGRSAIQRDGVEVYAGLERLGEGDCRLKTPIVTRTLTLPPLHGPVHTPSPGIGQAGPKTSTPQHQPAAPTPKQTPRTPLGPSVNPPSNSAPITPVPERPGPSLNLPPTSGGEEDGGG